MFFFCCYRFLQTNLWSCWTFWRRTSKTGLSSQPWWTMWASLSLLFSRFLLNPLMWPLYTKQKYWLSVPQDHDVEDEEKLWRDLIMERVTKSADACLTALNIMTSAHMPKAVYIEDVIERVLQFTKFHLQNTLYPQYDPVYRVDPHGGKEKTSFLLFWMHSVALWEHHSYICCATQYFLMGRILLDWNFLYRLYC